MYCYPPTFPALRPRSPKPDSGEAGRLHWGASSRPCPVLLGPGDCLQGGGPRDSGRRTTPPTALGTSGSRRGGRASWRCEAAAAGSADRFPSECTCQGVSLSMLRSVLVNMEARRHRVQRRCAASFIILFVCLFLICFPKTGPFRFKWQITLPPTSLHPVICQLTSGHGTLYVKRYIP